MIKEQVKKHDQLSFEVKLEFPRSDKQGRNGRYLVDLYLFLPNALDVNKHHFSKQNFYNSLKTYIRLTTPFFLLQSILNGKNNPYDRLFKSIKDFIDFPNEDKKVKCEFQIKRFCSIFGSSLRHSTNHILKTSNIDDKVHLIGEYVKQINQILEKFRNLRTTVNVSIKNSNIFDIYLYADEYLSLLTEKHVFALTDKIVNKTGYVQKNQIAKLNDLVLQEMIYRENNGYMSVARTSRSNEDVLHRSSRLKKFIESNLFLNTDTKKDGVVFEQLMFSFAAGLAMVFATTVAFASQAFYGNLTLPFFIALVISYMFKDRIKELIRLYLNKNQQRYYHDFKTSIYNQKEKRIGNLKESFQFVKHKHLPDFIFRARNKMRSTEISNESFGEKVILYRNKIKIFKNKVESSDNFSGFTEILRMNISDFTSKMDDSKKMIFMKSKNGFKRSYANRVYYLNMILAYSGGKERQLRLYKLVVHKNGIDRISRIPLEEGIVRK